MTEHLGPFFSVVIPTFQRNGLLAKCLTCLSPDRQLGMVLVDGITDVGTEALNQSATSSMSSTSSLSHGLSPQLLESSATGFPTYEIIVADDGRTSTAEAMIHQRFPWVRWVQGPGIGPAANRNAGAAVARGVW